MNFFNFFLARKIAAVGPLSFWPSFAQDTPLNVTVDEPPQILTFLDVSPVVRSGGAEFPSQLFDSLSAFP